MDSENFMMHIFSSKSLQRLSNPSIRHCRARTRPPQLLRAKESSSQCIWIIDAVNKSMSNTNSNTSEATALLAVDYYNISPAIQSQAQQVCIPIRDETLEKAFINKNNLQSVSQEQLSHCVWLYNTSLFERI